jgi:hypothetical protein
VNAVAPVARTRLTKWLGDGPAAAAADPLAPEHVAPVVAWLLGPGARHVTGRVIEAGDGTVSIPEGWAPGTRFELPPQLSPAAAGDLLGQVLAQAAAPPAILTGQPAGSDRAIGSH